MAQLEAPSLRILNGVAQSVVCSHKDELPTQRSRVIIRITISQFILCSQQILKQTKCEDFKTMDYIKHQRFILP